MSLKLQNILLKLANDVLDLEKSGKTLGEPIDEAEKAILDLLDKSLVKALDELRPPKEYEEIFKLVGREDCVICGFSPTKMNNAIDVVRKVIKEEL